jgi:transmembrane sensor
MGEPELVSVPIMHLPLDPRWDRLPHLFAGELPEDEAHALGEWIDADVERRAAVERMREVWGLTGVAVRSWDAEAGLAAIQRRTTGELGRVIAQVGERSPFAAMPARRRQWLAGVAAAAAAVFLTAGGMAIWDIRSRSLIADRAPSAFTEYAARRGQRLALRLQDGTLVTLAPASTLRQPATYGRTDRTLYLDGEASFVVTHDAAWPFAVHTAQAVARDLGTRFVVRAYAADSVTEVVVAEGSVAVRGSPDAAPGRADSAVLGRGQGARLTPDGKLQTIADVALAPYFDWIEGRLTFRDTPLADVARRLARWHNVEIRLADSVTAARRLTATFGDEPFVDVLHRIATSLDIDVSHTDRTFILRARQRDR